MTLDLVLNEKSLENAIHRVELYKNDLQTKTRILTENIAKDLKENAENQLINHVETGETFDSLRLDDVREFKYGFSTRMIVSGAAVWLEFGTGVVANHATPGEYLHPKAVELGMSGLGTFGDGKGSSLWGWWYYDENGRRRHTYGIPATMFMYYSAWATREKIPSMARGLFHT